MKIEFVTKPAVDAAVLVVLVPQDGKLGARGDALDRSISGALQRSLALPRFKGKKGEVTEILVPVGTKARRVILLGLGQPKEIDSLSLREAGGALAGHLLAEFEAGATVLVDSVKGGKVDEEEIAGFERREDRRIGVLHHLADLRHLQAGDIRTGLRIDRRHLGGERAVVDGLRHEPG